MTLPHPVDMRRSKERRNTADRLAVGTLAVIKGADTVRAVGAALLVSSPNSAHRWVRRLVAAGLIRDLADEAGAPKTGHTLAPAFRVVAGVSPVTGRWMVEHGAEGLAAQLARIDGQEPAPGPPGPSDR